MARPYRNAFYFFFHVLPYLPIIISDFNLFDIYYIWLREAAKKKNLFLVDMSTKAFTPPPLGLVDIRNFFSFLFFVLK